MESHRGKALQGVIRPMTSRHQRPDNPHAHMRLPLVLFLVFSACYLLTMSGHMYTSDEETMYVVTRRIALEGDVAVVAEEGTPVAALRGGADKRGYAPYGILPSLLALPFFTLGALAAPPDPAAFEYVTRLAVAATNGPVTAATAAWLAAWLLRLGARRSTAVIVALLYALCTYAWPYARTFFSEPLAALLLLVAVERADAARQSDTPTWPLICSGLAAGLLIATRIAGAIALPFICAFAVWPREWTRAALWTAPQHPAPALRGAGSGLRRLAAWGSGLLPGFLLVAAYNIVRFGTVLATGYGSESDDFTTPIAVGLHGLLLSPGKSVFLFAPPILLAFYGGWRLRRSRPGLALVILGLFVAHVVFYARWSVWSGGAWGPRFLLPTIPLLMVLAGAACDARLAGDHVHATRLTRGEQIGRAAAVALGVSGFLGALSGVLVNFDTYVNTVPRAERTYTILGSPLIGHWRLLADRIGRYAPGEPHCALTEGFFAPERSSALFPRRTGSTAVIDCRLDRPVQASLSLNDGRPPAAPESTFAIRLGDASSGAQNARQARTYTLLLPSGHTPLRLQSITWNPRQYGFSDRDDDLGVVITAGRMTTLAGTPIALIDRAIEPLPTRPDARFAWYYEAHNQHLVDHWAWYLPRSEVAGRVAEIIAAGIGATAALLLILAVALCRGSRARYRQTMPRAEY